MSNNINLPTLAGKHATLNKRISPHDIGSNSSLKFQKSNNTNVNNKNDSSDSFSFDFEKPKHSNRNNYGSNRNKPIQHQKLRNGRNNRFRNAGNNLFGP